MTPVLTGIRVVEQGTFITGPACGMLLGDLGADVVKVEQPGTGDPFRAFKGGLYSPHYQTYNRNKRSVTLDPKDAGDRDVLDALVESADVYIQNFRPGVAEKLGVGEKRLRALNPRLVYCSISGFGATGPAAARPAYDTVAQAASGFLNLLVNPENPRVVGPAIADAVTGFYAAMGVLAALYEREATGKGRHVETSMFEAMCHFNLDDFTHYLAVDQIMGPYSRPHVSQSYVFECADGGWIALHMSSPPKFWENLATAMGVPDMLEREEFATRPARIKNYEKVIQFLAPIFKSNTRQHWDDRLTELEVPHSPILNSKEVLEGELGQFHQVMAECEGPRGRFRTIRSPLHFDGEIERTITAPPELGQDNAQYLANS